MVEPTAELPANPAPWHGFHLDDQAVRALHLLAELLPCTAANPYLWKWVVAATHGALHGFMALALRRTDGAQLLVPKHERQTYERWERDRQRYRPLPHDEGRRVDQFLNLFEKVQDEGRMRRFVHSAAFVPTEEQDRSVRYLDRLRNDLTRYGDTTRIVLIAELPRVVLDCVGVVDWLLTRSNNVTIHEPASEEAAGLALHAITAEARRLADRWAPAGASDTAGS